MVFPAITAAATVADVPRTFHMRHHDENNHGPNERIEVEGFFSGMKTTAAFLFGAANL